jgi:hypothetical protein
MRIFEWCILLEETTLISYVDNGTLVVQSHTWEENINKLHRAYGVIHLLTQDLGLILEHNKSEVFHFTRNHREVTEDLSVNLGFAPFTGDTPLKPKRY